MRAGRLRRIVSLQASTGGTRSGTGSITPVWKCKGKRRAARRPIRQSERDQGDQTQADADFLFEFRQDEVTRNIGGDWRMVEGSTVSGSATIYDVLATYDPTGGGRMWQVKAKIRGL